MIEMEAQVFQTSKGPKTRKGDWIQTVTGGQFWPLDPHPEDILIEDIAWSLAKVCRFGGHCQVPYCPTPEQRILTADLEWKPAGDLRVGDLLVGFDEDPIELGSCGKRRRRFRPSFVTVAVHIKKRVIRLEMEDGSTIRSSEEHPWLIATKQSRNQKWVTAKQIQQDLKQGRSRYLHKFVQPWTTGTSRAAGWLAGIYDGEGNFAIKDKNGSQLGVSQLPGLVLDKIHRSLAEFGFDHGFPSEKGNGSDCVGLQIRGGWRENLRLLGSIRPIRLLSTFRKSIESGGFNKQLAGVEQPLRIVRAYSEGYGECIGLETSTHTYFCEGYGAHNSVGQHCILGSIVVETRTGDFKAAQGFLLHDASEAYLGDVTRPLKHMPQFAFYREAEAALVKVIEAKFDVDLSLPIIHEVDNQLLSTERRDLLHPGPGWGRNIHPLELPIHPWGWKKTAELYTGRFAYLNERIASQ